ncbi:MAG: hypothetical protein P8N76_09440 [Pirellulaceae bacterium]|nr:hypothetical protein [Pirellulaceae bacterium]
MTDSNPYKSPVSDDDLSEIDLGQVTTLGVWRDGNLLVMAKNANLPQRCLKTNGPASPIPIRHRLAWHHPSIYLPLLLGMLPGLVIYVLVIYVLLAIIFGEKTTVDVWLSDRWKAVRRRRLIIAWSFAAVGIVTCLVSGLLMSSGTPWWTISLIFGLLLTFVGTLWALQAACVITPKRITGSHVWLKGVHPEYLGNLPPALEMSKE